MEGSISELSGWQNPEPDRQKMVDQETAQNFGKFTFALSAETRQLLAMHDFAENFLDPDEFEVQLQENVKDWTRESRIKKDELDNGFWLNKPA